MTEEGEFGKVGSRLFMTVWGVGVMDSSGVTGRRDGLLSIEGVDGVDRGLLIRDVSIA
jgi:hypothetical protein